MPLTSLECQASELVDSDTCPRPTTQESMLGTVSGISVDAAVALIQDKIQQKLEGGPAGLRRAFQYFDEDGSGTVDHSE